MPDTLRTSRPEAYCFLAAIGVHVTAGYQFEPEQTTAALVVPHPDAKYYALARSGGE